jgi:hypothetical protein
VTARLTSAMHVGALIRRVGAEGGNAVVVERGDATAGSILLICLEKGVLQSAIERVLDMTGRYVWAAVGDSDPGNLQTYLERRRAQDPDLWIIELDIPNAERFAAELG